ncbi:MAG: sulfurtransferase TusA family protein [Thermodesulfobacteriota bacterium]
MPSRSHHVVDFKKEITPLALLRISGLIRNMEIGQTIEIRTYDEDDRENLYLVLHSFQKSIPFDIQEVTKSSCNIIFITMSIQQEVYMTIDQLSALAVSHTVDARGSACPGPLLEAKKGIGKVKVGEVLEIYSSDPGTKTDIPAWAKKTGHEFLGVLPSDGYDKLFVRRKK